MSAMPPAAAGAGGDVDMHGEGGAASSSSSAAAGAARAGAEYNPTYQRFLMRTRSYGYQFSHIYTRRTNALRGVVLHAAKQRWMDADGECTLLRTPRARAVKRAR